MKLVSLASVLGLCTLGAIVASGCSPSKDLEASLKPATPAKSTSATDPKIAPTGATITGGGSSPSTSGLAGPPDANLPAAKPDSTPSAPVDTSKDNPNRAFQLWSLAHSPVKVNGKTIDTWVMDSDSKRGEGMMFLTDKDVRDDQGMIFVFQGPQTDKNHGFYMKNTILPLDIIYIGADHKVLNIQEGKPMDEANLPSSGAYTYVLELKQGQAAKLGIKPGVVIELSKDLSATN